MDTWGQWARANFNVLFLGALFLIIIAVTLHALHDKADASSVNWLQGIAGQFMAALVGLMTGARLTPTPPPANKPTQEEKQ